MTSVWVIKRSLGRSWEIRTSLTWQFFVYRFFGGMVTLPETNISLSYPLKWMIEILVSFWDGPFVAAMLVLGRVSDPFNQKFKRLNDLQLRNQKVTLNLCHF